MTRSLSFTVALVIALAIVTMWWQLSERRARHLAHDLETAQQKLAALQDSLAAGGPPGATGGIGANGADAVEQALASRLREDLSHHPELIPFKGTLGGTMFFDTSSALVFRPDWVFVRFEDGHIGGRGVYQYRIDRDGRISWKKVAANID